MARKDAVSIRLSEAERRALELAAAEDDRGVSAMARRLIVAVLKQRGWLKESG